MTKVRIAAVISIVLAVGGVFFVLSKSPDKAPEPDDASASSAENVPAPEPAMTTESIPQPRSEGFRPPPSDVAGISKPEGEPTR